ncbi:MAG: hypothetical protein JWO86_6614 [Myxococcaceae bacterium]|jgi:hypothetical protein|nr:hypothetical protein [Myxococcaceae bacterium]
MTLIRTALIVALTAGALACNKSDSDRASQTTTTRATATPSSTMNTPDRGSNVQGGDAAKYQLATARIAGARCDREVTCEQIGTNKRFSSRDVCARDEVKRTQDELKSTDCPNGIDNTKLASCLASISQQDCGSLVTSLQTVDQCKTAALCIAP